MDSHKAILIEKVTLTDRTLLLIKTTGDVYV